MTKEEHKIISNTDEANDENGKRTTISERKLAANRANAGKSTGPRTERGKSYSRLNSFKHGLLAKKVMFDGCGKLLDPELLALYDALRAEYGTDDIRVHLLLDTLIMDYWRIQQGLETEIRCKSQSPAHVAHPNMPQIVRYATANRNLFMKTLALLPKVKQSEEEEAATLEEGPQPDLRAYETQPVEAEQPDANREQPASDIPRRPN